MRRTPTHPRSYPSLLPLSVLLLSGACIPLPMSDDGSVLSTVINVLDSVPDPLGGTASSTGGDGAGSTEALLLDTSNASVTTVAGSVSSASDVQVYDLGAMAAGDFVAVEISGEGTFDPAGGLFTSTGDLLLQNDDRNFFAGLRDTLLQLVVPTDLDSCLLAVATSPDAPSAGAFRGTVSISRGAATPTPAPQTVVLDFDGQSGVSIGGTLPANVPAFDATVIDPSYAGQTDTMIATILERVAEDFAGYNVTFRTTADGAADLSTESVVYFGTYSATLLGLADNVDAYNADPSQQAIIYTDTFGLFMPLNPSVDEMAQSLANVASHEIGHLLGLSHTADPRGLMDITATASQLLIDQQFSVSPLAPEVLPYGRQDANLLLLAAVGESSPGAAAAARIKRPPRATAPAPLPGEVALPKSLFCSCDCRHSLISKLKRAEPQQ